MWFEALRSALAAWVLDAGGYGWHLIAPAEILLRLEVSMVAKYDIVKKTNNSVVWVEAVEDIVTAKKRLISLGSDGTNGNLIWDSTEQRFIDLLDDCA